MSAKIHLELKKKNLHPNKGREVDSRGTTLVSCACSSLLIPTAPGTHGVPYYSRLAPLITLGLCPKLLSQVLQSLSWLFPWAAREGTSTSFRWTGVSIYAPASLSVLATHSMGWPGLLSTVVAFSLYFLVPNYLQKSAAVKELKLLPHQAFPPRSSNSSVVLGWWE
jgi:hypothetical protein